MPPAVFPVDPRAPDARAVAVAAGALAEGRLVIFPTETIYGWAARADRPGAMERLRAAKSRDPGRPFTLHLAGEGPPVALLEAALGPLPATARALAEAFLPGPLTLVLPRPDGGSVGVRVPDDAVARAVLLACPFPVVATSVNRSGEPACTDGAACLVVSEEEAPWATAVLLDAGPARLGIASTVVRCGEADWEVLREGAVPLGAVDRAIRGWRPPANSLGASAEPR